MEGAYIVNEDLTSYVWVQVINSNLHGIMGGHSEYANEIEKFIRKYRFWNAPKFPV